MLADKAESSLYIFAGRIINRNLARDRSYSELNPPPPPPDLDAQIMITGRALEKNMIDPFSIVVHKYVRFGHSATVVLA